MKEEDYRKALENHPCVLKVYQNIAVDYRNADKSGWKSGIYMVADSWEKLWEKVERRRKESLEDLKDRQQELGERIEAMDNMEGSYEALVRGHSGVNTCIFSRGDHTHIRIRTEPGDQRDRWCRSWKEAYEYIKTGGDTPEGACLGKVDGTVVKTGCEGAASLRFQYDLSRAYELLDTLEPGYINQQVAMDYLKEVEKMVLKGMAVPRNFFEGYKDCFIQTCDLQKAEAASRKAIFNEIMLDSIYYSMKIENHSAVETFSIKDMKAVLNRPYVLYGEVVTEVTADTVENLSEKVYGLVPLDDYLNPQGTRWEELKEAYPGVENIEWVGCCFNVYFNPYWSRFVPDNPLQCGTGVAALDMLKKVRDKVKEDEEYKPSSACFNYGCKDSWEEDHEFHAYLMGVWKYIVKLSAPTWRELNGKCERYSLLRDTVRDVSESAEREVVNIVEKEILDYPVHRILSRIVQEVKWT